MSEIENEPNRHVPSLKEYKYMVDEFNHLMKEMLEREEKRKNDRKECLVLWKKVYHDE